MPQFTYSQAQPRVDDIASMIANALGNVSTSQGGYGGTGSILSSSGFFQKPGDNSINTMGGAGAAQQLASSAGFNMGAQKALKPQQVFGTTEMSSAQKLALQKAEEERARKEQMNSWQEEWKKTQQIKERELRDRLAEIRAQGLENRKTQFEGYEQTSVLGKENKEMSAAQVYAQLMSALGGF